MRYIYGGPVDRHGLRPRDDKSGIFHHEGSEKNEVLILSLREGQDGRRGNPSCLEGGRTGWRFVYWLTVDRHGLRPRDDKVGKTVF